MPRGNGLAPSATSDRSPFEVVRRDIDPIVEAGDRIRASRTGQVLRAAAAAAVIGQAADSLPGAAPRARRWAGPRRGPNDPDHESSDVGDGVRATSCLKYPWPLVEAAMGAGVPSVGREVVVE
jgi:hypothetical protein